MEIVHQLLAIVGASLCLFGVSFLLMEQLGALGFDLSWRERSAFAGLSIVSGGLTFIFIF
jgi:hypothetical protein